MMSFLIQRIARQGPVRAAFEREKLFMLLITDSVFITYRQKFSAEDLRMRPPVSFLSHQDRIFHGPVSQSLSASRTGKGIGWLKQGRFYFKDMGELLWCLAARFSCMGRKQDFLKRRGIKCVFIFTGIIPGIDGLNFGC